MLLSIYYHALYTQCNISCNEILGLRLTVWWNANQSDWAVPSPGLPWRVRLDPRWNSWSCHHLCSVSDNKPAEPCEAQKKKSFLFLYNKCLVGVWLKCYIFSFAMLPIKYIFSQILEFYFRQNFIVSIAFHTDRSPPCLSLPDAI